MTQATSLPSPPLFLSELFAQAETVALDKGTVLFRQGDPVRHIFLVLKAN
jgi:CRP-like cAMP-binding protein